MCLCLCVCARARVCAVDQHTPKQHRLELLPLGDSKCDWLSKRKQAQDESPQRDEEEADYTSEDREREEDSSGGYIDSEKLRRSKATSSTTRNGHPAIDSHPLKPWVHSLRKSSVSAGGRQDSHGNEKVGARVRGEPLGAMRARWSSVPSRVREDVRKDRQKWLDRQARGEDARTMLHVMTVEDPGGADSSGSTDASGPMRDAANAQCEEGAGLLGFDDALVHQQCRPLTRQQMADQLARDRLSRYFEDAQTSQVGSTLLDRHLNVQARSYYKPQTQPVLQSESGAPCNADAEALSPSSEQYAP